MTRRAGSSSPARSWTTRCRRADDLPLFDGHLAVIPCLTNPLGVKGCGEAGSIVAPAAVMNAVAHALREHGGHDAVAMPATPQAIWRILLGPSPPSAKGRSTTKS